MGIDDTTAPAAALGIGSDHRPQHRGRRPPARARTARRLSGPWAIAAVAVWAAAFLGGLAAAAFAGPGDSRPPSADATTDDVAVPLPATTAPAGPASPATTATTPPPPAPVPASVGATTPGAGTNERPAPAKGRGPGKDDDGKGRPGKGGSPGD